jgi:uncharacterized protein YecE (DUF72 family)
MRVNARITVGCTGWSYDEWVGILYPPGTQGVSGFLWMTAV